MICHFIQFRAGLRLDQGRPLSHGLEHHLAHCPRCAAWYQAQREVIRRLQHHAPASVFHPEAEPSPFLQAKIMQAITSERSRQAPPVAAGARLWLWAGGAVAAAAAAVIFLANPQPDSARQITAGVQGKTDKVSTGAGFPDSHNVSPTPGSSSGAAAAGSHSQPPVRPNPLLTAAGNLDQPLRRELALLNADAMAAVRALKTSFLPGGVLPLSGKH